MGDESMYAFGAALQKNRALQKLSMWGNDRVSAGARAQVRRRTCSGRASGPWGHRVQLGAVERVGVVYRAVKWVGGGGERVV